MANDFRNVDLRDADRNRTFMDYLSGEFDLVPVTTSYTTPWFSFPCAHERRRRSEAVCEHPAALLVLADALATCDGCGRVFELRDFGK